MTTTEKTCFKCHERKPLTEFYRHGRMLDGHLNKCKTCTKRDVKCHRRENIDRIRQYDRNRDSLPHRIELRSAYAKTDAGKAASRMANRRFAEKYPHKKAAATAVSNAIRDGRLRRQPCEQCGEKKTQAHHDDYSKPLDVRWLCIKCHNLHHKLERQKKRDSRD